MNTPEDSAPKAAVKTIALPEFCLVVLIGPSGAGKSTFARKHFLPTEVISSDACRGMVADDENDQSATGPAFDLVHFIAEKRLQGRRLAVIDATNVRGEDRAEYVRIARRCHALPVAIVLNPGEEVCQARNAERPDRQFGPHVVRNHIRALKRGIRKLPKEGFRQIHELRSVAEMETVVMERQPLWTDKRHESGPFDIIGDVHGCCDELEALLAELGYQVRFGGEGEARRCEVVPPPGRRAVFVGDLVDRGPRSPDVLRLVMSMMAAGSGFCVIGNHENKFLRWLHGRNVKPTHGLAETIAQMEGEPEAFRDEVRGFLNGLLSHHWLDGGRLVVAHAGLREDMIGRASGAVRSFCMYGETTGETDEFGLPVRYNWAADYRGDAMIVYGHTPVPEAEWLNRTICLDTGCVFGGKLTALRYPELELVSVPAARTYFEPVRPLEQPAEPRSAQAIADDMLDLDDVRGKRMIQTRLHRAVTVNEANSAAALEAMTRFAINPKWLVYLPPTMSPSETSEREGLLEHPTEAFAYFRKQDVASVICQEKHMGSRAVILLCRSVDAARRRFGTTGEESGVVYSRTGRDFFFDADKSEAVLARLRSAADGAGLWDALETDWLALDAEIMPWSAKAQALLRQQYAPVGTAARLALAAREEAYRAAALRGVDLDGRDAVAGERVLQAADYAAAYRRYCWPVESLDDYRIAPFHLLASEGAVHMDKGHRWHMDRIASLTVGSDPLLMATQFRVVEPADDAGVAAATEWWRELTEAGGEGMVVKPLDFIARGPRGFVQPAVKCRGKEYLRIIYGPDYDAPENIARLRRRGLGRKRSLAAREFALGHEALHRFVAREPLRRVHECVFGVLALESEPVDPRL
ncbi:polynucleotide kinase-phosphatase [Pelagibius sp.]|uniref:polynucleotide kinase-phosphatase n=1 Tax=Pelagibius sp. TaxID=1931238 RepID=UPI0026334C0B|nr:polynucleotide kinase-phosphatase [Pelagibius sp.]